MSASGQFAQTDFPAEVEDLVSEASTKPTFSSVAGYAIIASETSPHALIFALAAGSGMDPISIALQRHASGYAPSLAAWAASMTNDTLNTMGVAILTRDAVLRVYSSVKVRKEMRSRCEQVRLGSALAASAGVDATAVVGLKVIRTQSGKLMVFGGRDSVALVSDMGGRLEVRPVLKGGDADRNSRRISKMIYSAFRSIGGSGTWGSDWEMGQGAHEIVNAFPTNIGEGVIVVRSGGSVERWSEDSMMWSFNVFEFHGGRESGRTISAAGITSDDTLAVLVKSFVGGDAGHRLITFGVVDENQVPAQSEMVVPLLDGGDADAPCPMVISGDTAYFFVSATKTVAWTSIARGVPKEGQVQGSTELESETAVFDVLDATFGLPESNPSGGVAAFIQGGGVFLASSAVPAPISLDKEEVLSPLTSIEEAEPMFWRCFLQYCAGQRGAAKATLQGLINSLASEGFNIEDSLSDMVERASGKIISSEYDPEKEPTDLLIDTELSRKEEQHCQFLRLLGDAEVFAGIRPDANSLTEDRIWTAIGTASRYISATDGEKLASARRVRELQNRHATRGYAHPFNDALSGSIFGSELAKSTGNSRSAVDAMVDDDAPLETSSILVEALHIAGSGFQSSQHRGGGDESATFLYRFPREFHRFLPALDRALSDSLSKTQSALKSIGEDRIVEIEAYRRQAHRTILLACEAVIEVVQGSRKRRESTNELFESTTASMNNIANWMFDSRACGNVMMGVAQTALEVGSTSNHTQKKQLFRAAAMVVDELLSRTPFHDPAGSTRDGHTIGKSSFKRRRVELDITNTERGKELRTALALLRNQGLENDAFRIAEKHEDFSTLLSLRVSSDKFDTFLEDCLEKFGDDFAIFAFQWLEERSHLKLLLRGQSMGQNIGIDKPKHFRSSRMNEALSRYFAEERVKYSNLAWTHWMAQGQIDLATGSLLRQIEKISIPGKKGSAVNTTTLSSIAKLSLYAFSRSSEISQDMGGSHEYVAGKLLFRKLQDEIDPTDDSIWRADEIIRRYIDESPSTSDHLAMRVVHASEALTLPEVKTEDVETLHDYIWMKCIERQSEVWLPLVSKMAVASDVEMRQRLKATAVYKAAKDVVLTEGKMAAMIARGGLAESEFAKKECLPQITSLVKAAVSLAVS